MHSRRNVSTQPPIATPLLLIFHGRSGTATATAINAAVRGDFDNPKQLQIASIVDLSYIPRTLQGPARMALDIAYHQAARQLPSGLDPADFVVILPDWSGDITRDYGMHQRVGDVGVAWVTRDGIWADAYTGAEPVQAAIRMARTLMPPTVAPA